MLDDSCIFDSFVSTSCTWWKWKTVYTTIMFTVNVLAACKVTRLLHFEVWFKLEGYESMRCRHCAQIFGGAFGWKDVQLETENVRTMGTRFWRIIFSGVVIRDAASCVHQYEKWTVPQNIWSCCNAGLRLHVAHWKSKAYLTILLLKKRRISKSPALWSPLKPFVFYRTFLNACMGG